MGTRTQSEILNDLNIATAEFMPGVVSQINNDNFMSARLLKKSQGVDGGNYIAVPLKYGREHTQSMGEYDEYNLQPNEILDEALFEWRHIVGDMVLSEKKLNVQNTGKQQLINLAQTKAENLSESMRNKFSSLLFTDSSDLLSTDLDSLLKAVATKNNTVGGIDASLGESVLGFDWNPNIIDHTSASITWTNLVTAGSTYYIERLLRLGSGPLTIGSDHPTVHLVTRGVWDAYEHALREDKRYSGNAMTADGGFEVLKFRTSLVAVDNHVPGGKMNTTSDNGGMILHLNEKYLGYRHHNSIKFRWTPWKKAEKQPVYFSLLEWYGNFIVTRRDRQGATLGLPTDAQVYA